MGTFNASSFYPVIRERWKNASKIDNEIEATSLAGYIVKFPSRLPPSYRLQFGVVETAPDNSKHVSLFFSKNPVTDSTRFNEFFAQKGIWIVCRKENVEPQKPGGFEFYLPDYIRDIKKEGRDVSEITINGHKGLASNERDRLFHGIDIHDPSQVEFVMDKTHVILQGYFAKEELIAIAQSIK